MLFAAEQTADACIPSLYSNFHINLGRRNRISNVDIRHRHIRNVGLTQQARVGRGKKVLYHRPTQMTH